MKKLACITLIGILFSLSTWGNLQAPPTAPHVDLDKYLGEWYEVASIPHWFQKKCATNSMADYSMAEDNLIRVVNSCETKSGKTKSIEGRAKVVDNEHNSKFRVTFIKLINWVFALGGDYWILDVSPSYSYALVGEPSLKHAWILSRTPAMDKSIFVTAEEKFRFAGYDTCKILTSVQKEGLTTRTPLCNFVRE